MSHWRWLTTPSTPCRHVWSFCDRRRYKTDLLRLSCECMCRDSVFWAALIKIKFQLRLVAKGNRQHSRLLWSHQLFGSAGHLVSAEQKRLESGYFQATPSVCGEVDGSRSSTRCFYFERESVGSFSGNSFSNAKISWEYQRFGHDRTCEDVTLDCHILFSVFHWPNNYEVDNQCLK